MSLAPIVFFVYNRPDQTAKTLQALSENEYANESTLYIFCDGPKKDAGDLDISRINSVRAIADNARGFKKVEVFKRKENIGLANSIISGVTDIINKYGKIIVLEDDILTSKYFLKFMNDCLDTYENIEKVFSVGACNFFAQGKQFPSSFFIPIPDCWGWATWKNRWQCFEDDSNKLLQSLEDLNLKDEFNLFGACDFLEMLTNQSNGKIDSWAIRWQAVCYLQRKLAIYPNPSLTQHIHSTYGTHAVAMNVEPPLALKPISITQKMPSLNSNIFIAMLNGYSHGLLKSKVHLFLKKIRLIKILAVKYHTINRYIKNFILIN